MIVAKNKITKNTCNSAVGGKSKFKMLNSNNNSRSGLKLSGSN